jgi:membrane-associated phospholipid phosphatase
MPLRAFIWFTATTFLGCLLLIVFFDQPLALFTQQHLAGARPFFAACTQIAEEGYTMLMWPIKGLPLLFVGSLVGFLLIRIGLRQPWGNVFLLLLLTHIASQVSANLLKGAVHRLRPEALFGAGYTGLGFWQVGPNNDSFPSAHVAVFFSLFWPFVVAFPRYRIPLLMVPAVVCIGRLILGQHYVSDVWFSGWLVIAWAELFSGLGLIGKVLYGRFVAAKLEKVA